MSFPTLEPNSLSKGRRPSVLRYVIYYDNFVVEDLEPRLSQVQPSVLASITNHSLDY